MFGVELRELKIHTIKHTFLYETHRTTFVILNQ